MNLGVIVGCNRAQQWLLPVWWRQYRQHNRYPVLFADFGMSPRWQRWCRRRGRVLIAKNDLAVASRRAVAPEMQETWERSHGSVVWQARAGWFLKLAAMARSPYDWSLWIDLDCEVLASLQPIFDHIHPDIHLAMSRDELDPANLSCNSGVVLFRKGAPFLQAALERARSETALHPDDQTILDLLREELAIPMAELHPLYNWSLLRGLIPGIVILHWRGVPAKRYLRRHGGLARQLQAL